MGTRRVEAGRKLFFTVSDCIILSGGRLNAFCCALFLSDARKGACPNQVLQAACSVPYRSTYDCVKDLERHGHLVRIREEVDPHLEAAAIHRRVFSASGPALLFENLKGTTFPAVSNLFGTMERARFIFRERLQAVQDIIRFKAGPEQFLRRPGRLLRLPFQAIHALPLPSISAAVLKHRIKVSELPQIQSWPDDGGPFITLPQVLTETPGRSGILKSNIGMYRIQLSGNNYEPDQQIGLHYQIHRGIGVHHTSALARGERLKVAVFVGGPPAHTVAAVMPLPEGLPEAAFAGALSGRCFRFARWNSHLISADADFCLVGHIAEDTQPEGPFGDHLGYYSLKHDFPVMQVEAVFHRKNAIWPFTVVGRPPQEDTIFGKLIHELTGPMVPVSIPGLRSMHAVDAAGVHPLLLAIGSERYAPYQERRPRELLTIANAILGFGQASLAKYLLIVAGEDAPELDIHDISGFMMHLLERFDPAEDLHFQTRTTIDTLDYSGTGLNSGSKLVIVAAGPARRKLSHSWPRKGILPTGFTNARMVFPGVATVRGPKYSNQEKAARELRRLAAALENEKAFRGLPLVVVVDDSEFAASNLNNFLWTTFTRSNPSHDVHGVRERTQNKHWLSDLPIIIDARIKPHHAPPLVEDPAISKRIERLFAAGASLEGID